MREGVEPKLTAQRVVALRDFKVGAAFSDASTNSDERVHCLIFKIGARFQPGTGVAVVENNPRTDSRESTTIVNTPRIVPKGNEEAFDASHYERERVAFAERKRSAGNQNTDCHC